MACINALRAGACAALISATTALQARNPNIERAPLGNNDLCCAQVRRETAAMDRAIEEARMQESQGNTTQTAGAAVCVATEVISRRGGFCGALGGITGHGVGTVAGRTASPLGTWSGTPRAAPPLMRMARGKFSPAAWQTRFTANRLNNSRCHRLNAATSSPQSPNLCPYFHLPNDE